MSTDSSFSPRLHLPADKFPSCQQCGISFVWTGWEQQRDDAEPSLCPGCRQLQTLTQKHGVVKWFDARKGFGFITMADGADIFVRRHDVKQKRRLRKGQLLSFRIKEGKSGPRAVAVRIQN